MGYRVAPGAARNPLFAGTNLASLSAWRDNNKTGETNAVQGSTPDN